MSTIGTGRSREGACVLLSATAEAKVFKWYDDVLKSGDNAALGFDGVLHHADGWQDMYSGATVLTE